MVAAEGCPNTQFRKALGQALPDCRAYERVSPADKNGSDVGILGPGFNSLGGPVAADGDATAFAALGPLPGSRWGGTGQLFYLSRRDSQGWTTTPLVPPPAGEVVLAPIEVSAFSRDMTTSLLRTSSLRFTDDPVSGEFYFYTQDHLSGRIELAAEMASWGQGVASSADLSGFAFSSDESLTADPGQPPLGTPRVYEHRDGLLRLAGREPGSDAPFAAGSVLGASTSPAPTAGAVSDDGRHVFFTAPPTFNVRTIYRRSDGTVTAVASPDRRDVPDPNGARAKIFVVASGDGNRVFFRSCQMLTDDANESSGCLDGGGGDLYLYDFAADRLFDLSAGTSGSTPAAVRGVVGISDDGDRAYFVATGQVVPGQGVAGGRNLYRWWDDGTAQGGVRFIASLDPRAGGGDLTDDMNWAWNIQKQATTTPDGGHLIFQSRANLTGYEPFGTSQSYLYDEGANGGAGALTCISCGPGPSPPAGSSFVPSFRGLAIGDEFPRAISDDGRRVAFTTPAPLLTRDTNDKLDAYLWEEGRLHLLSSGTGTDDSYAFGVSASGDDAFFRTRDRLVPGDGDTVVDLYTAHVDGGFESQQDPAVLDCQGDGCQGAFSPPPPLVVPFSASPWSFGNVKKKAGARRCSKGKRRIRGRCVRRHQRRDHGRAAPRGRVGSGR